MSDSPVARASAARDAALRDASAAASLVARGLAWDVADGPCPDGLAAVDVAAAAAAAAAAAESWARCVVAHAAAAAGDPLVASGDAWDADAVWLADAAEYHAADAAAAAGLV